MKITLYQKILNKWHVISEYYSFHRDDQDDRELPMKLRSREPCPGCGTPMTTLALNSHKCWGGQCGWPILDKNMAKSPKRRKLMREINDAKLKEYVAKSPHKTQFSD